MHTSSGDKTIFHHNGGYDGDVFIQIKDKDTEYESHNWRGEMYHSLKVPMDDILELVGGYIDYKLKSMMDSMSGKELLHEMTGIVEEDYEEEEDYDEDA